MDQQTENQRKDHLMRSQLSSNGASSSEMAIPQGRLAPWFARQNQNSNISASIQPSQSTTPSEDADDDEAEDLQDTSELARAAQMQASQQQSRMMMAGQAANQQNQAASKADPKKQVKNAVRQGIKRGILGLADMVGVAVDSSTGTITMLVDIFMYAFTLGWLDLEMIAYYKTYLRKEPIISPLDWSPVNIPLSVIWLHIGLVILNLAVLCLVVLAMTIVAILVMAQLAPALVLPALIGGGGLQILKQLGG